jgi:hypothetical protein
MRPRQPGAAALEAGPLSGTGLKREASLIGIQHCHRADRNGRLVRSATTRVGRLALPSCTSRISHSPVYPAREAGRIPAIVDIAAGDRHAGQSHALSQTSEYSPRSMINSPKGGYLRAGSGWRYYRIFRRPGFC